MKPRRTLAMLCLLVLVAPAQAQIENPEQSTSTQLYFHIWDTFSKFVINTQDYNASFFESGGVAFPTNPHTGWDFNTIYGYSTAGPVEYDFIEAGRPRIHPETGIARDVLIDPEVDPVVYLYVDPRSIFGGHEAPAHLPEVTFQATMREGDDPGTDLNDGEIIMSGETTVHMQGFRWCPSHSVNIAAFAITGITGSGENDCYPAYFDFAHGKVVGQTIEPLAIGTDNFPKEHPDGNAILYPDAAGVVEIAIPMKVGDGAMIPKDESYNIRLDWFQTAADTQPDDTWQISNLRMVMNEAHQSRLSFNIMNPIYIEFIHPQVAAGTLLIHTGVNSPWGTYDIDPDSIEMEIIGPSAPQSLQRVVAQNAHVHGLHDKAAEITYLWYYRDEGAQVGDYEIVMRVNNTANTATAEGRAGFHLTDKAAFGIADTGEKVDESNLANSLKSNQKSPGPGIALLGLLAFALARRRA